MKKFGSWTEQTDTKFRTSGDSKIITLAPPTTGGADKTFTTPNASASDTLISRLSTDTGANRVQNKELSTNNVNFVDNADTTKKLAFDLTGITGTKTITVPNTNDTLVTLNATQTLSNKTLTLPQINDTSADHQYLIQVSELAADRNVTLPLLGADDTFVFSAHGQSLTNKTIDADLNTLSNIENADIKAAAGIVYSKLSLGNSILNADINTAAAIAYSKLNLSASIINADINASAAIAYSKLALSNSIVNADINTAAAIAYSKLALSNSIVNADINTAAAIAYSKLALSNSIVNADINTAAAIAYSKLNLSGAIVNADINASAAIAMSKLAALTNNKAVATNASGALVASTVSDTELGYVAGVTSAIQTQINSKITEVMTTRGDVIVRDASNVTARLPIGSSGQVLQSNGLDVTWATLAGTGDVTAAANIADNRLVRGDGGAKGIQQSGIVISDSDHITSPGGLYLGGAAQASFYSIRTNLATNNIVEIKNTVGATLEVRANASDAQVGTSSNHPTYLKANDTAKLTIPGSTGYVSIADDLNLKLEIGRHSIAGVYSYIKPSTASGGLRITNAADTYDLMTFPNAGGLTLHSVNTTSFLIDKDNTHANHDAIYAKSFNSGAGSGRAAAIYQMRYRNTVASPTIVAADDIVGFWGNYAYDGSNIRHVASMAAYVDGTPGISDMPGRLVFNTTPDGSATVTERMRINNAGRVVIGNNNTSASPIVPVHIEMTGIEAAIRLNAADSAAIQAALYLKNINTEWALYTHSNSSNTNLFLFNGSNLYTFTTAGALGINNTPKTYSQLHLAKSADAQMLIEDIGNGVLYLAHSNVTSIFGTDGSFSWKTGVTFASGTIASGTERMVLNSNGNLILNHNNDRSTSGGAIGNKLNIETTGTGTRGIQFTNNQAGGAGPLLTLVKTRSATVGGNTAVSSGDELGILLFQGATGATVDDGVLIGAWCAGTPGTKVPAEIRFYTSTSSTTTHQMTIDSGGSVKIGTTGTAPTAMLHVQHAFSNRVGILAEVNASGSFPAINAFKGGASDTGIVMDAGGNGTGSGNFRVHESGRSYAYRRTTTVGDNILEVYSDIGGSGNLKWRVEADGGTISATGSYTSDSRIKKDVEPIAYGLDEINQLEPVSYRYNHEDSINDAKSLGLLAQDVQAIMPEMVRDDGLPGVVNGETIDLKALYYIELIPVLIKAVQELSAKNTELENRIIALENP